MKFTFSIFTLLLLVSFGAIAQQVPNEPMQANYTGMVTDVTYVPSIASRMSELTPAKVDKNEMGDKRSLGPTVIIGKDRQVQDDYHVRNRHEMEASVRVAPPIVVFDAAQSSSQPTDPSIAVGPNHLFVVFNTGFTIWDKTGTTQLLGQTSPNPAIFPSGGCCDLTVSYDNLAQRWVVSFLGSGAQIAVSDGPDPLTAGWNVYNISQINDYQKLSVWSDGYYLTDNTSSSNRVWAMERDEMLLGNPAGIQGFNLPGIVTSGFYSPQAFSITDNTHPAAGGATIVYLQDDAWSGVSTDHMKYWTIDVDWATPGNSTVSANTQIPLAPFISVFDGGSFSNLSQPGGGIAIDALQATIMNQAHFRKFGTHNSAVFNFVVDTDASGGELAGIRWMEFRQPADNTPWTLFQSGTYTAPDGRHAWHASLAMDGSGNIGMGYSSMSGPGTPTTVRVSSYYTGRFDGDPLGTMTVIEEVIANGNANIPGLRYGDYSKIDVDPADDTTFWFINEYMNSGRKNVVGAFQLAPPGPDDIGISQITTPVSGVLTAAEVVTVDIRNYGSNNITNPMLQYTVDGGPAEVEMYTGTIAAGTTEAYTFTATADLSGVGPFVIEARTNLAGDTNAGNDGLTKVVQQQLGGYCQPMATAGCNLDGIKMFVLNTITADDGGNGCNTEPIGSPQGYADRTALSTDLSNQAGGNVYTLQAQQNWTGGPGVEALSVWIDFDDSGTFEPSERLISGEFFQADNVLEDFTLTIPTGSALGPHRLRAKAIDTSAPGDILDPCTDFDFGEVQDYTVVINDILSVQDQDIIASDFVVLTKENNQFEISLISAFEGVASISIYNVMGQRLAFNNLEKQNDRFVYKLDMSYAGTGVYFIKMGDRSSGTFKTGKIIVK